MTAVHAMATTLMLRGVNAPVVYPPFPLQMDALTTLPGILTTLLVIAVVIFVARIALKIAWRIVLIAAVIAAVLWILGLLGPLSGLLGV